ncbi:MAG: DNA topoisomerase I [Elusimicrobia bacterium RIFCSPLOWO2_01_FULL_59_12]|nr:MAG: DNA topoisomerase I [Elusimicrobia bacterium RIFCSPLOWO2_01_FULL_59_12]
MPDAKSAKKEPTGRSIIIVESPTKQKTIAKFLGNGYVIVATLGHIRDLPSRTLGVDENNDFEPQYVILPKAKKVLPSLKEAVRDARKVYLATDYDREGEAIAWHVAEALKLPASQMARITFHEITPEAIRDSLQHPRKVNMALVHSQQARRILDRLVGYKLSPLLWSKVRKGLSAGRVQSVALRLLVEREEEIKVFKAEGFWTIKAELQKGSDAPFQARLVEIDGKKIELAQVLNLFADEYRITTTSLREQDAAELLAGELKKGAYQVVKVVRKEAHRSPPPPFMTAALQQDAVRRLGFSAIKTMVVAQQLYEGVELGPDGSVGLITYMRTDSLNVAASAQAEAKRFISKTYGAEFLPKTTRMYKSKSKGAQEAHEAIRPTSVARTPESIRSFLTPEQARLYDLIWRRFVASQMADAVFDTVGVDITSTPSPRQSVSRGPGPGLDSPLTTAGNDDKRWKTCLFHANGRTVQSAGFLKVYADDDADKAEGQKLPLLKEKDAVALLQVIPESHKTDPPPRYNEASLIKMLERHGIGRPSTYAPILQTIIGRGYVRDESRRLFPSELGIIVTDLLKKHFAAIVDLHFTANVEDRLDEIAQGTTPWPGVIRSFYVPFMKDMAVAQTAITTKPYEPKESGELCEKCKSPMLIRESRFGRYLSCKAYPACKNKISLNSEGKKILPEVTDRVCEACGKPMLKRIGRRGPFLACSGYPECRTTLSIDKAGNVIHRPPPQMTDKKCEKCAKPMLLRVGKRGPFLACSGFPRCRNLKKIPAAAA